MFFRAKKSGAYQYLQVVENQRINGKVRQRVIATVGRVDLLAASGELDGLLSSGARFAQNVSILDAHRRGALPPAKTIKVGPVWVFERLWKQLGIPEILEQLLEGRKYEFPVERAIFLTVLHRLMCGGSDRAAEQWCRDYAMEGMDGLALHHLYRAMAWLGEALPGGGQIGATPFAPRCHKDQIEEALFARRRDLYSGLELVFFDTTSIYFEGEGGQTVGRRGHNKDHRPDLKQMVVAAVLSDTGQPICCELWPGNTADVKTLIPVVNRLREKFGITRICIVADRGMISRETIAELGRFDPPVHYILGARMRAVKEVRQDVLGDAGPFEEVYGLKQTSKDPSPLAVKEVRVGSRRYVVCRNEDEAKKDRADREAIVEHLRQQLRQGDKSLVGNKGYQRYLKTVSGSRRFEVDEQRVQEEAKYDGLWVLQTDTALVPRDVALRYQDLWMVEAGFRTLKSVLETRPVWHKCDETIRGHVFCSFLALALQKELMDRLAEHGWTVEWERLKADLERVEEITVEARGLGFVIRSQLTGDAGKAIQAAGVALGPTVRVLEGGGP